MLKSALGEGLQPEPIGITASCRSPPAPSRPGLSELFAAESGRICFGGGYFCFCFAAAAGPCGWAGLGTEGPEAMGSVLRGLGCAANPAEAPAPFGGPQTSPGSLSPSPLFLRRIPSKVRFKGDFARASPSGLWIQHAIIFRLPLTSQRSGL